MIESARRGAHPRVETFWDLLSTAQRRVLETAGTRHAHPAGTVLLHQGAPSGSALVLLSGRVKIVACGRGGYQGVLAVRVPGDIVGELAAIDGRPRSASVVAIDPVDVLRISSDKFHEILTTQPGVAHAVLRVLVSRLRMADLRRVEYGETTVAQRVATALSELAAEHGVVAPTGIAITLPFGQEDLAGMVTGSRESVVRALRALRDEGVIRTGRKRITILQPEILGHRASGRFAR